MLLLFFFSVSSGIAHTYRRLGWVAQFGHDLVKNTDDRMKMWAGWVSGVEVSFYIIESGRASVGNDGRLSLTARGDYFGSRAADSPLFYIHEFDR